MTYHSVGPNGGAYPYLNRLSVDMFRRHMTFLKDRYEIVALDEGLHRLHDGRLDDRAHPPQPACPRRPLVAITIDDGYGDVYDHIFPVLRSFDVPATVFLATDYLDTGRLPWPTRIGAYLHAARLRSVDHPFRLTLDMPGGLSKAGRLLREKLSLLDHGARDAVFDDLRSALDATELNPIPPLTWAQVRQMARHRVQFGSHTCFHGWLDRLQSNEVEAELLVSKARIESETGVPCRLLAYPNGNWSPAVAEAAHRAAYGFAFAQDGSVAHRSITSAHSISRLDIPHDEGLGTFACRVTGLAL
ncbi:MAG: polysaccharide deacetylase family protein [Pseudomonadota bacterium]